MIFEVREYVATPGRLPAVIHFFNAHTTRMFTRYGVELVCAGQTLIGENSFGELVYTLRFVDLADLESKWNQILADPEWQTSYSAAEEDGPLIQTMRRRIIDDAPIEATS